MTPPRVIAVAGCTPVPWANGAGTTRDLALGAASGPGPAFDWRLSLADLPHDAPFSAMPGVDRVFTMAGGDVELDFTEPPRTLRCRAGVDVHHFAGEAAPASRLLAAPGRALNLMLARGRAMGAMRWVSLAAGETLDDTWLREHTARAAAMPIARQCLVVDGEVMSMDRVAAHDEALDFDPAALSAPVRARSAASLIETVVMRTVQEPSR